MTQTNETQTTNTGIPVTYKEISNYDFQGALAKLRSAQFKDGGRCAYLVKKMSQAIEKLREKVHAEYRKEILDLYAQRDEKGEYNEEQVKIIEGKQDEFKKALEAFEARSGIIDRPKFLAADIREAHLTAAEQEAIDPILDDTGFDQAGMKGQGLRRA
jgi:hypothetical protein